MKFIRNGNEGLHPTKRFRILLYTTIFLTKKYCNYAVNEIFGSTCPTLRRCEWTCDRHYLRQADAIIFHAYDIEYYDSHMPNRNQSKPNAIWILWSDEPPTLVDY